MSLTLSDTGDELRTKFLALKTRKDIADLLDIDESHLIYHLYILSPNKRYKSFNIAKRSGTKRRIDAPATALKILQRKLNQVLQYVYPAKPSVHGFIQNKSILTNARTHLRRRFVLNVDLKDFFPSINFGRVRGMFMSNPYNFNPEVATVLAQICCFNNQLPQGAPTSPTISNMICGRLDDQLQRLARRHQCLYTRYADDITFSTHLSKFPEKLAKFSDDTGKADIGIELLNIIKSNGFNINPKKIRLQTRSRRQQVTGITVNKIVNVRRNYINQIRAMLHAWKKYGLDAAEEEFLRRYDKKRRSPVKSKVSFSNVVKGKIEYLGMVKGKEDPTYLKFYDQFCELAEIQNKRKIIAHLAKRKIVVPRVMTEGKTDWRHLKIALNKLQMSGIHSSLHVDFVEYDNDMPAGGGELKEMCARTSRLRQDIMTIFVFDNDDRNITKDVTEKDNLYKSWGNNVFSFAIPIPNHRNDTPEISIELYYKDSEITRLDKSNRRIFLSSEFRSRSGRHKTESLSCTDLNKIRNEKKLIIIDNLVFNEAEDNVALTKSDFADYIYNQENNFNDFDYTEFRNIFDVIQLIIDENSN